MLTLTDDKTKTAEDCRQRCDENVVQYKDMMKYVRLRRNGIEKTHAVAQRVPKTDVTSKYTT